MAVPPGTLERLTRYGHRLTGQRRAVLDAIGAAPAPFSIEEICEAIPGVGRATTFRTVKLLQELDLVCRVPLEDGTVRYQLSQSDAHHHHLVCSGCGAVAEFSDAGLDARIEANARASGFRLESHSVELYGLCRACASTRG
ncbi:MAG: Fur family transcriptional regulator [Dehalococcoidia bacterium]